MTQGMDQQAEESKELPVNLESKVEVEVDAVNIIDKKKEEESKGPQPDTL